MKRDFPLALFSAIAGVAIGYALNGFDTAKSGNWLLLAVLVLSMIVPLTLIGPLSLVFRSPGKVRVEGKWLSRWQYTKGKEDVVVEDDVEWTQHGQYISGKASSVRVTGPLPARSVHYKLSGRVTADGVMHGSWSNVDESRRYSGVFQGRVHPSGERITGAWIGTDSTGVQSGSWELTRLLAGEQR